MTVAFDLLEQCLYESDIQDIIEASKKLELSNVVSDAAELRLRKYRNRRVKFYLYVKENGKSTNSEYQEINKTSDRTVSRDLENLLTLGVFKRVGEKKGAFYELKLGGYGG